MKFTLLFFSIFLAAGSLSAQKAKPAEKKMENQVVNKSGLETATFGSGCFWCTEAIFLNVDGVVSVVSGYTGGKVKNPTYKEVCSGLTGHAEVVQLTYNPAIVTYDELLEFFWKTHDPTTLNRQGNDEGTQYRSVVYYHTDEQKRLAEHYRKKLNESGVYNAPIITEISPAVTFYKAEDYHQNYYNLNSSAPYCSYVIQPKLEKFRKVFKEKLKKTS
jgi:peptide-methionine (S)-S-oxide reductase